MKISVAACCWGLGRPSDIEALLVDTASHLNRLLRTPFTGTIVVVPASSSDPTPRVHYRSYPNEPFPIQLAARDSRWAQFAYQFSHEFCHIMSDYERLRENPNGWLRCLPSDVWQSGGPSVPHIPIGLSTRIHCSAMLRSVSPVKTGSCL